MENNNNNESHKLLLGVIVGGAVGAAALYLMHAQQHRKPTVVQKIGKTITEIGEALESGTPSHSKLVKDMEKKFPTTSDVISTFADWANTGVNLWKKLKQRM